MSREGTSIIKKKKRKDEAYIHGTLHGMTTISMASMVSVVSVVSVASIIMTEMIHCAHLFIQAGQENSACLYNIYEKTAMWHN